MENHLPHFPMINKYDYTLDKILEEIVDTLDQLGVEKVHLLGGRALPECSVKHLQRNSQSDYIL